MLFARYNIFIATILTFCVICILPHIHNPVLTFVLAIPSDQTDAIFTTWKVAPPPTTADVQSISIGFSGTIYFADEAGNKIGRLVPSTNTITEWTIPTNSSHPIGVDVDSLSGNVYFIESNGNKIGRLVPPANTITEWTIPTNSSHPIDIQFDSSSGNLYFAENNTNKIGRLDLSTNSFTEWTIQSNPSIISIDSSGNVYFVAREEIGRLS